MANRRLGHALQLKCKRKEIDQLYVPWLQAIGSQVQLNQVNMLNAKTSNTRNLPCRLWCHLTRLDCLFGLVSLDTTGLPSQLRCHLTQLFAFSALMSLDTTNLPFRLWCRLTRLDCLFWLGVT